MPDISTIRVILPRPQIVRFNNVTVTGSGGNLSVIDLGIISASDAMAENGVKVLLPYKAGQFISGIRFLTDGFVSPTNLDTVFCTPRTNFNGTLGYGYLSDGKSYDTSGQYANSGAVDAGGNTGSTAMILDTGPLVARLGSDPTYNFLTGRTPDTPYALQDAFVDPNNHLQYVTTAGVSGSEVTGDITWDEAQGTTSDGTVTWQDTGLPIGAVHVVVEVVDLPSVVIPQPKTLAFVQQPSDVEAGSIMDPPMTIRLLDGNGDPFTGFQNVSIGVNILGIDETASQSIIEIDASTGIATFDNFSITNPVAGCVLKAYLFNGIQVATINSDPFDVTAP